MADRRTVSSIASGALAFARSDRADRSRRPTGGVQSSPRCSRSATFLGFVAVRIASRPKLNFDEHIFLDVGRHLVDTGLPLRAYAEPGRPTLFFDHTPLYVYFVALVTALGGPTGTHPPVDHARLRAADRPARLPSSASSFVASRSALVGSMLVAVNPFFVTYSWFVRMEVPMCFFLVLARLPADP